MTQFASYFPDRFASRTGDPFRADRLVCVAPALIGTGDEGIVVPAATPTDAQAIAAAIDLSAGQLIHSFAIAGNVIGTLLERLYKVRSDYNKELEAIRNAWTAEGEQVSPAIAKRIVVGRELVKEWMRAAGPIPSWVYKVTYDQRDPNWSPTAKIFHGREGWAISSAFKPNKGTNKFALDISGRAARLLRIGSYVVVAIEVPFAVAQMYNATTQEEQQAALQELGRSVGSTVGMGVGSALCAVSVLSSGGIGFLGCAAVTTGLSVLLGEVGSALLGGNVAHEIATRSGIR